jgi:uncharacterized protein
MFSEEEALTINLLKPDDFDILHRDPAELSARIKNKNNNLNWVIIDEIRRAPRLLDLVHHHIESDNINFALTGSSARKIKRGATNLLAGRALVYHLFPLTHRELGDSFNLESSLQWGGLPKVATTSDEFLKRKILQAYTYTYLKEEVQAEQLVRVLEPFHLFLKIAAQISGKIINFTAIASESKTTDKTVREYFKIIEETLLGFFLELFMNQSEKDNDKIQNFTSLIRELREV